MLLKQTKAPYKHKSTTARATEVQYSVQVLPVAIDVVAAVHTTARRSRDITMNFDCRLRFPSAPERMGKKDGQGIYFREAYMTSLTTGGMDWMDNTTYGCFIENINSPVNSVSPLH